MNWFTAAISRIDPFADMDCVTVNTLAEYDDVIVDPLDPVQRATRPADTHAQRAHKVAARAGVALLYVLLVPLATVLFLLNSVVQNALSARRIRLHGADKGWHGYRSLDLAVAAAVEEMNHDMPAEHLGRARSGAASTASSYVGGGGATTDLAALGFPTLALTPAQFQMVADLDALAFRKIPVWIQKDSHTHAGIIVRRHVPRYFEGKAVVRHWLEQAFEG